MTKPCNCKHPHPKPSGGPYEYVPSSLYPAGMHGPAVPGMGCCPPPPPPPKPDPEPEPWPCPPRIYRNPPDVELIAGRNISLEVEKDDFTWKYTVSSEADRTEVIAGDHIEVSKEITDEGSNYTVSAVQFPVMIDPESSDVLYGDGRPDSPLGVYDFTGATEDSEGKPGAVPSPDAGDQDSFLRGDGTWAEVPKQMQADWEQQDSDSPDYIRNKPDIEGMIGAAVGEERERAMGAESELGSAISAEETRATAAETAAATEVVQGQNVTVAYAVAQDGHNIYTVTVNECTAQMMDAWIDEVEYA